MKKQKKENAGITLIALVITIVILIILALISINAIIGEDGIISRTNDARLTSEQGTVLEDLRMEIYNKMSNPEYLGLEGLQYLKEQTGGKLRADNTVDITKVRDGIKSGKGSLETGDVYYIEETDLYYLDKEKKSKNLGQIFNDVQSLNPNLEINKEVVSTLAEGKTRYAVGDVIQYKITVKNIGTKTISGIKVEDKLTAKDLLTKEETERLPDGRTNGTFDKFETVYGADGNKVSEMSDTLEPGQTGYITYSYTVVSDDMGKDLSNKATVKGKNAIPKGEKEVTTPVEIPPRTIILTKTLDITDMSRVLEECKSLFPDILNQMPKNHDFRFGLYVYKDETYKEECTSPILLKRSDGSSEEVSDGFTMKEGEIIELILPDDARSIEISDYGMIGGIVKLRIGMGAKLSTFYREDGCPLCCVK